MRGSQHRWRRMMVAAWLACGVTHAHAEADDGCAMTSFASLRHAVAQGVTHDARAIWLSATLLRWPGAPDAARYRLLHSADAALSIGAGGALEGDLDAMRLDLHEAPLPPAIAARFRYLGEGSTLALRVADRARLDAWFRGQLLLVAEDAEGRVLAVTGTQIAAALDERYAAADAVDDLGVRPSAASTGFALWAPTARAVSVCIAPRADGVGDTAYPMQRDDVTGVWRARVDGDRSGGYYRYLVDVVVPGVGVVRNRVTDPYAISLSADSQRAYIGDLASPSLAPEGWHEDRAPPAPSATDQSIYELHVRDFSIGDASVPTADRGKYLAFTAMQSAGMRHLRALAGAGLTDVHLLPVFDLASIPESGCVTPVLRGAPAGEEQQALVAATQASDCFNWGYDPLHYTAPEGSYASDANDGAVRVRELRRMVQALHRAGLRVGMDVVYNHTSASGQQAGSVLDRIVPGYYHRLDARGVVERSTCCDNTATEHRMMAKLMRDSVVTWARDHHIDSFRFDLMGHQPRDAMLRVRDALRAAIDRPVALIGEGWNFGEVADGARFVQAAQGELDGTGIATFSDRARDAARGGGCCDTGIDAVRRQGWLNGLHYAPNAEATDVATREDLLHAADLLRVGLAGSLRDYALQAHDGRLRPLREIDYAGLPAGYVSQPDEVVNYVENHDNPTLFDLNVMKLPTDTSPEDRARVQILGAALVAFSQGIAYFHAGMDTLRSKSLDRNSFDSGDGFNRLDWTYRENFFGAGLPPEPENGPQWPWMRTRLADPSIRPSPAQIAWTRDAFRDLLRLRASTSLFRLRSADEIRGRLRFHNTGPSQEPTVVVGHLDGRGLDDARFDAVLYFINADLREHAIELPDERAKAWRLHPLQRDPAAADARAREAHFDAATGRFRIPARTAVVFVIEDVRAGRDAPSSADGRSAGERTPDPDDLARRRARFAP